MTVSASNPVAASYLWANLPRTVRTNDPNLSYRLFTNGTQVALGTVVDLASVTPCGVWSPQDWEDGGNGGTSLLLSRTDVHYDVRGTCVTETLERGARLTR